jgi:hypothetical protein
MKKKKKPSTIIKRGEVVGRVFEFGELAQLEELEKRHVGRPRLADSEKKEKTKVMRIPESKVDFIKKILSEDPYKQ